MRHAAPPRLLLTGLALGCLLLVPWPVQAEEDESGQEPRVELRVGPSGDGAAAKSLSAPLKVVALVTLLSLAPALLVMMTSFTRIIIVLAFVRHALSTQQVPPNIVLVGLALFMTLFTMSPVWQKVQREAYAPYAEGKLTETEAVQKGLGPLREFMGRQTRKKDLALFLEMSDAPAPERFEDVPTTTLVPAFVISELRTAFQMGFLIFLPFIVIDLVVATVLMSLGMVMLPPAMISLPLKLLLFVLADGWRLVVQSLIVSFQAG